MTSDASASAVLSNHRSYYEWNSSETSLQDYTIMVRFTLPEDFSDWASTAITVNYNTELTTNNTAKLDFITYNADASLTGAFPYTPVSMRTNQVSATAKTWTSFSIPQTDLVKGQEHDIESPGEQAIFYVKLYSKDNTHVQLGDIELNYLAKFWYLKHAIRSWKHEYEKDTDYSFTPEHPDQ